MACKENQAVTDSVTNTGTVNKGLLKAVDIQVWLISYLTELLEIQPDEIEVKIPFERYGMSSAQATILIGDLEAWVGYDLTPILVYEYPTIEALSQYIAEQLQVLASASVSK